MIDIEDKSLQQRHKQLTEYDTVQVEEKDGSREVASKGKRGKKKERHPEALFYEEVSVPLGARVKEFNTRSLISSKNFSSLSPSFDRRFRQSQNSCFAKEIAICASELYLSTCTHFTVTDQTALYGKQTIKN